MYPRTKYEMSDDDLNRILDACKPVPVMMIGNCVGSSPQENANRAWKALGERMGFDWETVNPIEGKDAKFFTAVPSETESQRASREAEEKEESKRAEITLLETTIQEAQKRLKIINQS